VLAFPTKSIWKKAAEILNVGKKVAILAGRGALGATDELEHTAELLAAPIIKALLGKAAVPDDSPYTTGGIGLLGTKPSQEAMEDCDTLLMVGTSFPYLEFMPKPGQARGVQIELDPKRIGLRYPVEIGLVGRQPPHFTGTLTPSQTQGGQRLSSGGPGGDEGLVGDHGDARHAKRQTNEATSGRVGVGQASA